jgi:hypothetical protein
MALSPSAFAQRAAVGEVSISLSASASSELDTDIDSGGSFSWTGAGAGLTVSRQFTPALSIGMSAKYRSERWTFESPGTPGSVAPWQKLLRPGVGVQVGYALAPDLSIFVAPQLEWSYESGASASQGQNHGAVVGVTKVFSPTLVMGLGLGAFRQIDDNRYFPFVIVNWRIDEHWTLSNPAEAGPAGGAGLELVYAWNDDWEVSGGAAYRDYRFRLRDDGATPNGIGRNSGVPVFARLTRKFGPQAQIDVYAGAVVGGRLQVLSPDGATLYSSDYGAAPLLAISGSISF